MSAFLRVECEGEAWISDFETEDLVAELKRRKQPVLEKREQDELIEVHDAIKDGRSADALVLLERLIWPKWKSEESCKAALKDLQKSH